jgi:tetratricopeptide (TPR) repeat protein
LRDFTRALEVQADDEASLRYRAWSYSNLKDDDGVIADMSRLIQMQLDNVEYYLIRLISYFIKEEWDKVIEDCNTALRLNGAEKRWQTAAYLDRGEAWAVYEPRFKKQADAFRALYHAAETETDPFKKALH